MISSYFFIDLRSTILFFHWSLNQERNCVCLNTKELEIFLKCFHFIPMSHQATIRFAAEEDLDDILFFIRQLAIYEKLENEVSATIEKLRETLFGPRSPAEVLILEVDQRKLGFALFFHNYSTFLAQSGIYLEDLFVLPEGRGKGYGKLLFKYLARLTVERNCGRLEWSVLDWNEPALQFYRSLNAQAMSDWTVHRLTGDSLRKLASSP